MNHRRAQSLTRINPPVAAALTILLTAVCMAFAFYGGSEAEESGTGPFLVVMVIAVVTTALIFGLAVPRASKRSAIAIGVLALVFMPVYWLALPLTLGAGAVAAGRAAGSPAAMILGALALVAATAASLTGV